MSERMKDHEPSSGDSVAKHVLLLVLWIVVGLLGFVLGMKWSSIMDENRNMPVVARSEALPRNVQASKDTVAKDVPEWQQCFEMDISIVPKTLQMLKEEYVDQINTRKLIAGALKGLKEKLESRKLSTSLVKPVPENIPEGEVINHLNKVYSVVLANYGSKIKESELTYAALKGLMDALGDPYSAALDPGEYKLLNEHMSGGNYGGIGIYIETSKDKSKLTVVEPIEGGPAYSEGIKSGDWIMKIDGKSTRGMTLEVAAQKIRGKVGSTVTLTVVRKTSPAKNYTLTRSLIHVKSVDCQMEPGNIAYIRIRFFGNETDVEFSEAIEKMKGLGAKGMILDLRNNGGGYISAAVDVCSKLLQSGTLIVSVVNTRTGRNEVHKASGSEQLDIPLAVIVNELSASAAEITAGALKDTGTGILIGNTTFGKGSVQTIHELKDGGALKYTIARYLTPKGIDINKKGIAPTILVKMESDRVGSSDDTQLQKALSHIREKMSGAQ